jgi:uncharacterized protein YgbK (DUF1537 family)
MRIAVIADDLTGAADTGVQLARAGYRTAVTFRDEPAPSGVDAVVADTDSRGLEPAEAAARARRAALRLASAPILMKKLDSTLRGPLAAELEAVLAASGRSAAVVAPAFPATGRTTVGGVQLVDGEPVHRTRFGRDPVSPVREADLVRLLGARHVAAGDPPAAALAAGGLVVCDAATDDDLEALVRAVPDPASVLWAGSAGLAAALGTVHPGDGVLSEDYDAADSGGPVLVVVGSANATAREQIARMVEAGVPAVPLRLKRLGPDEVAAASASAVAALAEDGACVLHPVGAGHGADLPRRIAAALAEAAAAAAERAAVAGLVLTGGDTAVHVARRLGATGLLVEDELEPGVVVGRLLGPRPYRIVTKAGGFGSPDALRAASAALAARGRNRA